MREKAMAPDSSTLPWKIPWMEEPGRLQSMGSLSQTRLSDFTFTFHFSCIGEGNGTPLQCPCLENPRAGGAWWAAVCGVAQSRTRLKRLSSNSSRLKYATSSFIFRAQELLTLLFSRSILSDSSRPHGLQHTRLTQTHVH